MAAATASPRLMSSIASLTDLSVRVVAQLRKLESSSKVDEVSESFQSLSTQLPLLSETLQTIKANISNLDSDVVSALNTLLVGIVRQLSIVETYLENPLTSVPKSTRKRKAVGRVRKEKAAVAAVQNIQRDIDVLVSHQTEGPSAAHALIVQKLSQLRLESKAQIPVARVEPSFSNIVISDGSRAHIGNYYEATRPLQLVPRTMKCGLCLGNSPKIDHSLFHGRAAEIEKMRHHLELTENPTGRRCLVLGGVGGIGKTQLALKYADCCRESYDSVFWLNASSEVALSASFREIAELIFDAHTVEHLEDKQLVAAVRQWMSDLNNQRWLLIYDNYDDPDAYDITKSYPAAEHGTIIVTSRLPHNVKAREMRVCPLGNIQDSLAVLQSRSERVDTTIDPYAYKLAERLAGFPLALATAGSYLRTSSWTFQEYLEEYEKKWNVNIRMPPSLPEYKDRTLYTTWNISYSRLQTDQPDAGQLLKLLAYFDNQRLWYRHFRAGVSDDLPEWLKSMASDPLEFENLMSILARQCFVEVRLATQSYSLHAAVHDWTLAELNKEIEPSFYRFAVRCVSKSIVDVFDFQSLTHLSYSTVASHAKRLAHQSLLQNSLLKAQLEELHQETDLIANLLYAQCVLEPAEQMFERALAGATKAVGPLNSFTLRLMSNIGTLYLDQDKLLKAERIWRQAMEGTEEVFGASHEKTLSGLEGLAHVYLRQYKLREAEEMLVRALDEKERVRGKYHPSTLPMIDTLGYVYQRQGRLELAEKMYERALARAQRDLGPEHTSTLNLIQSLGILHHVQGKLNKAEKMLSRALAGREKTMGQDHILSLEVVYNCGVVFLDQGKLDEAEKMLLRALAGIERIYGQEHTSTIDTIHFLGILYRRQGHVDKAKEMYSRELEVTEKIHGPDHPYTISASRDLEALENEISVM